MPVEQHWPEHFLLTFGGTFYGSEQWQMGLRLTPGAPGLIAPGVSRAEWAAGKVDEYAEAVKSYWGTANVGANRTALLEWVKFNPIGTNGKIDGDTVASYKVTPAITPAALTPIGENHPPQLALVLSMKTGIRGQRRSNARIYLPAQRMTMVNANSPYIDPAPLALILTAFKNFVADVNDLPGLDLGTSPKVAAVSKRSTLSDGTVMEEGLEEIVEVRVGNLYDTHRSRRGQLRETYTTLTL